MSREISRSFLIVQQRRALEIVAARGALEAQREQARAEYARGIVNDLAEAEQKVAQLAEDRTKAERKMHEQVLRAPIDGTVQQLAVHTVGGVVTAAQALMVVVPADAIMRERAGGQGSADRAANISGARLSEPQGQELTYAARISLNETRMQIERKMVDLAPGMAVTVEIKTGQRRIIEYLLSPLLRYRQESLRER